MGQGLGKGAEDGLLASGRKDGYNEMVDLEASGGVGTQIDQTMDEESKLIGDGDHMDTERSIF